ncbi:hypothetical protein BJ508DRAFT_221581 [Ascobolus immersus RN42]|uniref:Uncharacterized protein n=1 Tax=Ascobolus immersus RN42 TaxID=1160509 RepID=A0A3N4IP59_ASCIM|nr:hypothetical protein BJ508DRAFT_221581 [Ascobolus immersus RN42]
MARQQNFTTRIQPIGTGLMLPPHVPPSHGLTPSPTLQSSTEPRQTQHNSLRLSV